MVPPMSLGGGVTWVMLYVGPGVGPPNIPAFFLTHPRSDLAWVIKSGSPTPHSRKLYLVSGCKALALS